MDGAMSRPPCRARLPGCASKHRPSASPPSLPVPRSQAPADQPVAGARRGRGSTPCRGCQSQARPQEEGDWPQAWLPGAWRIAGLCRVSRTEKGASGASLNRRWREVCQSPSPLSSTPHPYACTDIQRARISSEQQLLPRPTASRKALARHHLSR